MTKNDTQNDIHNYIKHNTKMMVKMTPKMIPTIIQKMGPKYGQKLKAQGHLSITVPALFISAHIWDPCLVPCLVLFGYHLLI